MSGLILGIGLDLSKTRGLTSGYSFSDADAQAYYDELVVQNGGSDINATSLYSISLSLLKETIDTLFIDLKADSTYSEINKLYLCIGGTADTHSVNAINATSELTYTGSPTHGADGVTCNGTTQYVDVGTHAGTFITKDDGMFGMYMKGISGSAYGVGGRVGTSYCRLSGTTSPDTISARFTSSSATRNINLQAISSYNNVIIHSATTNTRRDLYVDGSSVANKTNSDVGTIPGSGSFYFMGVDENGTPANYTAGDFLAGFGGNAVTSSQAATLTTALKTLNTTLGR